MADSSEVKYRLATHADCNKTMDINRNVYDGFDYLQCTYHRFIADPFRFPIVAELDGKVVGYNCCYVIDGGATVVIEAARVRAECQGAGIFRGLIDAGRSAAKVKFPNIRRMMWTSINPKARRPKESKVVTERPRVSFDSTASYLQQLCASQGFYHLMTKYGVDHVTALPQRDAIQVLSVSTDFRSAVPEGTLVVNFEPWGLHRDTFTKLLKTSTLHISDHTDGPHTGRAQMSTGSVIPDETRQVRCFSFHSMTPTSLGMRCRVDFYCPPGERANEQAVSHMLYHIREVAACNDHEEISFSILFHQHIEKVILKKILTDDLDLHRRKTEETSGLLLAIDPLDNLTKL